MEWALDMDGHFVYRMSCGWYIRARIRFGWWIAELHDPSKEDTPDGSEITYIVLSGKSDEWFNMTPEQVWARFVENFNEKF